MKEAIAHRKAGNYLRAKADIEKALKIKESELAYKELGNYYLEYEQDLDLAEKNYRRSLSINANYTNSLHNMGLINMKRYESSMDDDGNGNAEFLEEAKRWFEKSISTDSTFALTFAELGKYYFYNKEYETALRTLNKSISLGGSEAYCRNIMGQIYLKGLKQPEKALDNFQLSYSIFSKDLDLVYHISLTHRDLEHMDEGKRYFTIYINLLKELKAPQADIEKALKERETLFPEEQKKN